MPAIAAGPGVHTDDDVAHAGGDRGGGVLHVDLEARSAGAGRVRKRRLDPEVLGERHRRAVVAHAVDVTDVEAGVGERLADHRGLQRPAVQVELAAR